MAGYIGKSQGVTQVDGYNRTEADDRYVNASGDTMTGDLSTTGNIIAVNANNSNLTRLTLKGTSSEWNISNYGTQFGPNNSFVIADETNAAVRMVIDSAGRVTMPYQPFFKATGSLGGVAFSTSQAIAYDTVYNNVGNCYNSTTSTFVAPVSGLYQFYASYLTYPNADTSYSTLIFSVNGSTTYDRGFRRDAKASQADRNVSSVMHLNANDTVKVWLEIVNTTSVYNVAGHGHFSGYLIG